MSRQLFIHPEHDETFKNSGFVILPFLEGNEIEKCLEIYASLPEASPEKFHTSHWNRDENFRRAVNEKLSAILSKKAEKFLNDYVAGYNYFLVKNPGPGSEVRLHQDWTLVDETQFTSVIFWCPLTDTNEKNGFFQYVKNSHRFMNNVRGTGIEPGYSAIMEEIENQFLTAVPLPAGQALVFDQRLLHASPANRGDKTRIVVGTVLRPRESGFIHYAAKPAAKKYDLYEGGDDFLLKFAFGDDPDGLLTQTILTKGLNDVLDFKKFRELFNQYLVI